MAAVNLLWRFPQMSQRGKQTWSKPKQREWMRGNYGWVGKQRPCGHVSLQKFTVCPCEDRSRDICAVQCVGGVTYSVAPAAQQVVGQGVLRLQLDGFIQMVLGGDAGRQTGRKGDNFHCWFMKQLLFQLLYVLTWSVLLHQPTNISQTPLTHAILQSDHMFLAVTHPAFFFSISSLCSVLSCSLSPV